MINPFYIKNFIISLLALLIALGCSSDSKNNNADLSGLFEGTAEVDVQRLQNIMSEELIDSAGVLEYLESSDLARELRSDFLGFYRSRNFRPAWVGENGTKKEADEFLKELERSTEQGLNPEDYKIQYLYHLKKSLEKNDVVLKDYQKFDKELTTAYLMYSSHILRGRINPGQFDSLWKTDRREKDLGAHLRIALAEGSVKESLEDLEPKYEGYRGLKDALAKYRTLEKENKDWNTLPESVVLKPGDSGKYVPILSKMLYKLGDLEEAGENRQLYDDRLAAAVVSFQKRNGLQPDSVVAEKTLDMLNIPLKERIAQIKLNLERFRWMPEKPEGRHVVVNIPEYQLYVYEGKDSTLSMRVIVGDAFESTTPVFNDSISYITFSPAWTVPPTIASEEMLPKLQEDPLYLTKQGFKIYEGWEEEAKEVNPEHIKWKKVKKEEFPYRVVQNPGPDNSLGRVKFMFPNKMAIYLHDTPADYLFSKNERDLSHGCIRVEKPVDFAKYLLQEKGISEKEIKEMMSLPEPKEIPLDEKVPILIEYRTAWMGHDGRVNFREDIYGHDQKQLQPLERAISEVR